MGCGGGGGGGTSTVPAPVVRPPPVVDPIVTPEPCGNLADGQNCLSIDAAGTTRNAVIEATGASADLPGLLIALHGAPGTPIEVMNFLGVKQMAAQLGYVAAIPFGQGNWAWNSMLNSDDGNSSDSAYISAMIDQLAIDNQIDTSKVIVIGYSAGSYMAYQLVSEIPAKFKGIVAISGQLRGSFDQCTSDGAVALHHIHGTNDADVPFEGRSDGIQGAAETTAYFATRNGCAENVEVGDAFTLMQNANEASTTSYQGCLQPVHLTRVEGAGHEDNYDQAKLIELVSDFVVNISD
jgi:polyhydroxybutyrate depolymerase